MPRRRRNDPEEKCPKCGCPELHTWVRAAGVYTSCPACSHIIQPEKPPEPEHNMSNDPTQEWLDSQAFYEMLYAYRTAPIAPQRMVVNAFGLIKERIRQHVSERVQAEVAAAFEAQRGGR